MRTMWTIFQGSSGGSYCSLMMSTGAVFLWSVITGTRPGVLLLPQDTSLPNHSSLGKHKRALTFKSDLPKYISSKDLPDSVCYHDIKLFYLKDPQSKHDVLCASIEFHNLKGRPESADGIKFFMHSDYQLAYCLIAQIISFTFRDSAFVNTELTSELIYDCEFSNTINSFLSDEGLKF
ncbi:hypothetical protein ACJ72_06964 [Emergomyces africanus]|uniref:Uncharacterized protein n=1 Tax=Emergomyces africanus TaxID=1955775 RepID=A0A1B7NPY8_9EURO|nr:hypothetical protein ACJ72_06964 [Emergomyces africanus]